MSSCKRKDVMEVVEQQSAPKKPRLVFTDLQRRTLQAIFKETKRPSKEMQISIARQLALQPTTVGNFFMNARRRLQDKWRDSDHLPAGANKQYDAYDNEDEDHKHQEDNEEDQEEG